MLLHLKIQELALTDNMRICSTVMSSIKSVFFSRARLNFRSTTHCVCSTKLLPWRSPSAAYPDEASYSHASAHCGGWWWVETEQWIDRRYGESSSCVHTADAAPVSSWWKNVDCSEIPVLVLGDGKAISTASSISILLPHNCPLLAFLESPIIYTLLPAPYTLCLYSYPA